METIVVLNKKSLMIKELKNKIKLNIRLIPMIQKLRKYLILQKIFHNNPYKNNNQTIIKSIMNLIQKTLNQIFQRKVCISFKLSN